MPALSPGLNAEGHTSRILETVPITVTAGTGTKQVVDARGFAKIVGYPGSSGTIKYSAVNSPDATSHGNPASPTPSSADAVVSIDVAANFYMLEAGTADAVFHLIP